MSTIKPIVLMNEGDIDNNDKAACLDGIRELLSICSVEREIEVIDRGLWRNIDYKINGVLRKFLSVDWFLKEGWENSRNKTQMNALTILNFLSLPQWKKDNNYYDVFLLSSDIYYENTNFIIGLARKGVGTIISTNRFQSLNNTLKFECIKTETMHELGHVFGLLPIDRTENVDDSLGKHCTNRCIMRQGLIVPIDWVNITKDRLKYGPFCENCKKDLRNYFKLES